MKTKVYTDKAPKVVGPYSQAVIDENLIFVSGQIPINPLDGKLVEGTIEEQAQQVMNNLKNVLNSAGVDFSDVVKTTIYTIDMSFYPKINEVYASFLTEPFPARETVGVKELPAGARIEISMIAVKK